jgi:dolichol-phosphate mannosyltransferase
MGVVRTGAGMTAEPVTREPGSGAPILSVVLPVYNERETLDALERRLAAALAGTVGARFEAILVDDGSSDGSAEILDALHARDPRFKVIHFSRNFGHQAALQAGLEAAAGDAVVLMDADLQDPPELVAEFVHRWRDGHDVVYAVRRRRPESGLKRAAYAAFYRSLRVVAAIDLPLDAGDFCLIDRRVVDALVRLPERNRFLRGLRSWVGFRQVGVAYDREPRHAGEPKYTLRKLVGLALSGYVGFSNVPLRMGVWLGFAAAGVGFLLALGIVATKLFGVESPRGWVSIVAVVLLMGGVQLLMLGVIGEYLSRVYDEVRRRPAFIVRSRLGFDSGAAESGGGRPGPPR